MPTLGNQKSWGICLYRLHLSLKILILIEGLIIKIFRVYKNIAGLVFC